jgi:integrase
VLTEAEKTATEDRFVIGAIRLLLFTGCRLSEILELRWSWVNLERKRLELPDSKTGAKLVFLNEPAIEVLSGLPRLEANPFVVAGAKAGQHLVNLQKPWRRIRKAASLPDLRIHDLRHNYASVAAGLGEGLPMIGKLLGHSQAQTTHRYAHLAADPVIRANERVGAAISLAMTREIDSSGALRTGDDGRP